MGSASLQRRVVLLKRIYEESKCRIAVSLNEIADSVSIRGGASAEMGRVEMKTKLHISRSARSTETDVAGNHRSSFPL